MVDEASTDLPSAVTEKSTGLPATDKTGSEKANGSATHDKGKKTRGEPSFTKHEQVEMEALLDELCGHLGKSWIGGFSCSCWRLPALFDETVIYPTRFLEGEDIANNFLFNTDRLMPLPIYD